MKYTWMFLVSMALSVTLLILLSRNLTIGDKTLPPIGHFINPFSGFWNQAESGKAGSHESYYSTFLTDSIQIEFDKRMVPHIFARKTGDAFYAQGYLHAKNRLFQMDLTSRAMTGRLSEILGERALSQDIFARRINFPQAIENKYQSWQNHPDMMAFVEAYVQGVNDYINTLQPKNYPLEYKLLNSKPEKWTILKSISISLSLAATLNLNLDDFKQTNTLWNVGPKLFEKIFPLFADSLLPVDTDRESYPDSVPIFEPQDYHRLDYLRAQLPPDPGPGIGSNNWAVRAALTKDSIPLLANDPHLKLSLPSIWYELQMHTPEFNTHGVSVPGMPAIVIGFNDRIAWGLTNAPIDVLDTYKIKWKDKSQGIYILDGQEETANLRKEVIGIKGKPSHTEEIYDTYWGPVLYGNGTSSDQNIAVKWMSALPNDKCDLNALYGLMKAKDLVDYEQALESFYVPGQNIVFASVEDSIAITVQGIFPIKRPRQGRFILDGSLTSNDWQGIIPQKDLPRMINPDKGYVLSANEWPTYPDYPYYYSGRFDHYRGRTIARYLDSQQPLTLSRMKEIQNSNLNLKAEEILPALLQHIPDMMVPNEWRLNELLRNRWDIIFDQISTPTIRETASDIVQSAWHSARESYESIPLNNRVWGKHAGLSISHLLNIPEFSHQNLMTGGNGNTINATTTTNGPSWRMIVELDRDSVRGHVIYPGGQSGNPGSKYYDNFIEDWLQGKYYEVNLEPTPEKVSQSIHYSIYLLPK